MKALVMPMPEPPIRLTAAEFDALMDRPLIDPLQAWCLRHALCTLRLPGALVLESSVRGDDGSVACQGRCRLCNVREDLTTAVQVWAMAVDWWIVLGVKLIMTHPDVFLNNDQTLNAEYRRWFRALESALEECVLRDWLDDTGQGGVAH